MKSGVDFSLVKARDVRTGSKTRAVATLDQLTPARPGSNIFRPSVSRSIVVVKKREIGGERGIRTLDTLLTYTHFPGVRFQPLSHLSAARQRVSELTAQRKLNKLGELTEA